MHLLLLYLAVLILVVLWDICHLGNKRALKVQVMKYSRKGCNCRYLNLMVHQTIVEFATIRIWQYFETWNLQVPEYGSKALELASKVQDFASAGLGGKLSNTLLAFQLQPFSKTVQGWGVRVFIENAFPHMAYLSSTAVLEILTSSHSVFHQLDCTTKIQYLQIPSLLVHPKLHFTTKFQYLLLPSQANYYQILALACKFNYLQIHTTQISHCRLLNTELQETVHW